MTINLQDLGFEVQKIADPDHKEAATLAIMACVKRTEEAKLRQKLDFARSVLNGTTVDYYRKLDAERGVKRVTRDELFDPNLPDGLYQMKPRSAK